ncbi:MAG: hypothetical protein ACK56F_20620 [bacterium]
MMADVHASDFSYFPVLISQKRTVLSVAAEMSCFYDPENKTPWIASECP